MINNKSRIFALFVLMLGFLVLSKNLRAQNIVRNGNTFVQQSDSTLRGGATKTEFTYVDSKGN